MEAGTKHQIAADFRQEALDIYDEYVHGQTDRRRFINRAAKFAAGGVTAAALLDNLKPNYALAQQMAKNDERIVTAGWDNTAKIWDTQTGTELLTLIGHGSGIFSVTYSSNGQQIVTAN